MTSPYLMPLLLSIPSLLGVSRSSLPCYPTTRQRLHLTSSLVSIPILYTRGIFRELSLNCQYCHLKVRLPWLCNKSESWIHFTWSHQLFRESTSKFAWDVCISIVYVWYWITCVYIILAGVNTHSLDYKKSAGGFIHGFRYTSKWCTCICTY